MNCRICLDNIEIDEAIGDLCKCKDVFFHKKCAVKWFTPRIEGVSQGKVTVHRDKWTTKWYTTCEVCGCNVDSEFVRMCVLEFKRETFRGLRSVASSPNSSRTWGFFGCFSGS